MNFRTKLDLYFIKFRIYRGLKKFFVFCRKYRECNASVEALTAEKQADSERLEAKFQELTEQLELDYQNKHDAKEVMLSDMYQRMSVRKEEEYAVKNAGLLREYQGKQADLEKKYQEKCSDLEKTFQSKCDALDTLYQGREKEWEQKQREAEIKLDVALEQEQKHAAMIKGLIEETAQSHPWLAYQLADIQDSYYAFAELCLRGKSRPAMKSADELKILRAEKRELDAKCKQLEYQVNFWKSVLPWLEDFQDIPDKEAWKYKDGVNSDAEEYEVVREFLSPEEYSELPQAQKYQMFVDRYLTRPSGSAWKAGIKFERYTGYLLESRGWKVDYRGALCGLDDMGIDLIASKGGMDLAIQCKWWNESKTIHENYICQLVGSTAMMSVKDKKKYTPVFICTCQLSDTAREVAKCLCVELVEIPNAKEEISKYPCIKCNASGSEKIYHLPFDQMYDRTQIAGKKNSFFAHTIDEAENAGFRHAYRHSFNAQ